MNQDNAPETILTQDSRDNVLAAGCYLTCIVCVVVFWIGVAMLAWHLLSKLW